MDIGSIEGLNEDEIMNLFNYMTDTSNYNNIAAGCPSGVYTTLQCYDTAGGFGGTCYWSGCNSSNGDTVCTEHYDARYGFTHVFKCHGMRNRHICGTGQSASVQCYWTASGCSWSGCVSSTSGGSYSGGCVEFYDARYGFNHLFKCSGR